MGDRRCSIGGVSAAGDQGGNGSMSSGTAVTGAAAEAAATTTTTGALQHWPQLRPRAGLLGEYPGIPPPAPQQHQQAICRRHPTDDGCFGGDHQQNKAAAVNDADWYMDSGASDHVTMDPGNLSALGSSSWRLQDPTDSCIRVADGSRIPVVSAGSCHFPSATARGRPLVLRDVLVAPRLVDNLISVRRFTIDNSCSVEFDPYGYSIKDLLTQTLIARYDSPGEDRYLFPAAKPQAPSNSNNNNKLATSHAAITCNLQSGGRGGCQHDHLGIIGDGDGRAVERFDLVHCCISCAYSVASASGHKYTVFLVDDCSRFLWTFPLRVPSDIFPTLSRFFGYVRARFGVSVKRVQCGHGCRDLAQLSARLFFLSNGVELRAPPCPPNASSPHRIRSANAIAQSLLLRAGLMYPLFWADALDTATYLLNRHPTNEALHDQLYTPYFALHGTHPTDSNLPVFGCACYPNNVSSSAAAAPHIPPQTSLCVFLGYSEDRGYRCLHLASKRIVFSPSVAFVESWFPLASSSSYSSTSTARPPSSKDLHLLMPSNNDNDTSTGEH